VAATDASRFIGDLRAAPLIAIARGLPPDDVVFLCEALAKGGIRFVETALNSPEPFESIRRTAEALGPDGVRVGAGTVLTPEQVDMVAEAGGCYIVSPNFSPQVVRRTRELGLVSIPGFFSPSEAFAAAEAGADLLKCFPASVLGPSYFKAIRPVLPHPLLAVGGVGPDNAADYIAAGALAIGAGSSVVNKPMIAERDADGLAELARRFLEAIARARARKP